MFVAGDEIIMLDGHTVYSVLRATPEWYEIMDNDFMHLCQRHERKFIDDNFILVSSFNEKDDEED